MQFVILVGGLLVVAFAVFVLFAIAFYALVDAYRERGRL